METDRFERAIKLIDEQNAMDPNRDVVQGEAVPKELLYSNRMSQKLMEFQPNASEALQIATHAQHICRWKIPREAYPMNRVGYLKWRETLKKMHADRTADLLKTVGYDTEFIERVSFLITKKRIKTDDESQVIEDVICLVFLEYYFEAFANKHEDEKLFEILRKTWAKMSAKGHEAALKLNYSQKSLSLIKKAIS